MEEIIINVHDGKYESSKAARKDGQVPMVCYSKTMEPKNFTVEYQEFRRAYLKGGKSSIMTLKTDKGDELPVLVQEVQYEPISDDILHIDLKAVDKNQKISTEVPLVFVGQSAAVKESGGTLMTSKDKVTVECLPKDLPHEIEVDISPLVDFHSTLTVADIKIGSGIEILDAAEVTIATVAAPRTEEEEVTTETPVEGAEAAEGENKEEKKEE